MSDFVTLIQVPKVPPANLKCINVLLHHHQLIYAIKKKEGALVITKINSSLRSMSLVLMQTALNLTDPDKKTMSGIHT